MFDELGARRRNAPALGVLVLAATIMLVPAPAAAGEAATTLFADAIARYGPAGVMVFVGGARRWAQDDEPSLLARGRYAQLAATVGVNPAYAQGSLSAEWVPVAPLQLRLQYDAFGFFGTSGSLLRFPSPTSRFGPSELESPLGKEQAGIGHRVAFSPVLRAQLGRFILRNQTDLDWYVLSRSSGWYYESEYDTLLRESDWLFANRTAAMVELRRAAGDVILVGPMYDVTLAGGAGLVRQRLGATAYWSPAGRWLGLDRARVYALAGVNLSDRNHDGEPFALLGLGGDLDLGGR